MSGHAILLTGAPEADALDWQGKLLADFSAPIERFLGNHTIQPHDSPTPTFPAPKWRSIPMNNPAHDATIPDPDNIPQTQFLTHDLGHDEAESQERLRFLEHSLALLDDLDSSQIAAPEDSTLLASPPSFATATSDETSFGLTNASIGPAVPPTTKPVHPVNALNLRGDITNLARLPAASHLLRIHPQTLTVHLLVALISVSQPRIVRLRIPRAGGGNEMEIHELLLGDETRAGFSLSFWLSPAPEDESQQRGDRDRELREELRGLRVGDVVVWRNVALSSFRGCVYGQSLGGGRFRGNGTGMVVIGPREEGLMGGLEGRVRGKVERVRRWAGDFVGRTTRAVVGEGGEGDLKGEVLPPDTQESGMAF
ncbi:hypothetical protein LTR53_015855 [Teratosphaeriaceae sp. CCFEE 6253]|nr:hypothetical protein LTR53_015855 [Teratosphaeriaceae sp. CCFEE 6253]